MYIAIDIGGTNIRVASSASRISPHIIQKIAFLNSPVYADNLRTIIDAIHQLTDDVDGIGIGTPGRLNAQKTSITNSRTISAWVNKPTVATLAREFDCPVNMDGDPCCAALGETIADTSKTAFLYIGYGTGIGAARIRYTGGAPTVQQFSWEEHASYLHPWQKDCGGRWLEERLGTPAADLSDADWDSIMERFYTHLLYLIDALRPPRIVFGGGMAVKQWPRLQIVFKRLENEHPEYNDIGISLAQYGEDTGLYGAFLLVR